MPRDLVSTSYISASKEVLFRNRTSTFGLLDLFRRTAILAGFHGSLRITFENAFKVHITSRHPDKIYETEIFMVASELARDSIRIVESQVSYLAPDLVVDGWKNYWDFVMITISSQFVSRPTQHTCCNPLTSDASGHWHTTIGGSWGMVANWSSLPTPAHLCPLLFISTHFYPFLPCPTNTSVVAIHL
jgi:hypothetical protein